MLNLLLHCGSRRADRTDIEMCPTPARSDTWVPIPHAALLGMVERTLTGAGLTIVNQAHALSADHLRYFGLLEILGDTPASDYHLILGLRNSHDKQFPASLAVGSGVFVCDNLAFMGEITIARRHTVHIIRDLPQLVGRAIGQLGSLRQGQDRRIAIYKETLISHAQAHDLMVRGLDARVLPVTAVPTVVRHWREPSHREFADCGMTAWRLFNAFTEAVKGRCLEELPRRTQALHGLMDAACGLTGPA